MRHAAINAALILRRPAFASATLICLALALSAHSPSGYSSEQVAAVTVLDTAGYPIAGVEISVHTDTAVIDLSSAPLERVRTDDRGQAVIRWQSPRPVRVVLLANGFEISGLSASALGQTVTLRPGRDVSFAIAADDDATVMGGIDWQPQPGFRVMVSSDANGKGVLRGFPNDRPTSVTVKAQEQTSFETVPPQIRTTVFRLPPSAGIIGRVVDETGGPVSGAHAILIRSRAEERATDTHGNFSFERLSAGRYELEIGGETYRTEDVTINLRTGQKVVLPPVALKSGSELRARFVDVETADPVVRPRLVKESNEPVGFSIRDMIRPGTPFIGSADGEIRITSLPLGSHQLVLDSPPFARLRLPVVELASDAGVIDLGTVFVNHGAVLQLSVWHRGDDPAANMSVSLDHGPGLSPLNPISAVTDESGRASFDRLGPGRYRLRIGGDDRPGGMTTLRQEWFTVDGIEQTISKSIVVGGVALGVQILGPVGPVSLASVAAMAGDNGPDNGVSGTVVQTPTRMINTPFTRAARGMTDAMGRVALEDVPVGPITIAVTSSASSWSIPFDMPDRSTTTMVEMPAGTIALAVADAESRQPASARVSWRATSGIRSTAYTDSDGFARLNGVPPGGGLLEVGGRSYEVMQHDYSDASLVPAEVFLTPSIPTSVRCRLTGGDSSPLKDATIEVLQQQMGWSRRFAVSESNGVVEVSDLQPGAARIVIRRPGYASKVLSDMALRRGVNDLGALQLARGFRVKLVVASPSGRVSVLYRIRVLDENGRTIEDAFDDTSSETITEGGEALVGLLAPGRYSVELVSSGKTLRKPIRITDGNAELRFP